MNIPDFSLKGKVAFVTGGRRGIGRTIALAFAEAGADVALCDLVVDDGRLEEVAQEIKRMGRRSLAAQADTSRKADVDRMVNTVLNQLGTIDILVNNAGILIRTPLLDMGEDEWDKLMNVDLKGYFLCGQAVGRKMAEHKTGTIINIATQHAFKALNVEFGAYGVAKAGVVMLTRTLARELGPYGIRVNSIAPGMIKTDFSLPSWTNPELLKKIEASLPLGRAGETADLVGAALLLASNASGFITGHTILIDGGALA